MNVVAVHNVPGDPAMQGNLSRLQAPGATHGYDVLAFSDIDNLIELLRAMIEESDECIEILEISAHGNPTVCDGLRVENAQRVGEAINRLNKLCEECKIYLSGCNTGVSFPPPPQGTMYPMAKILAISTNCKVYGSVGYLSGTHAEGNTRSTPTCNYQGHHYPSYPGAQTEAARQGDNCYQEYTD